MPQSSIKRLRVSNHVSDRCHAADRKRRLVDVREISGAGSQGGLGMSKNRALRRWLPLTTAVLTLVVVVGQSGPVAADGVPTPNPLASLPTNPVFEPVLGVDITTNGPATAIHGDPMSGRILFARNCTTCHG